MEKTDQLGTTDGSGKIQINKPSDGSSHYVNRQAAELLKRYSRGKERRHQVAQQLYGASQYRLMLVKFMKHRVATVSVYLLAAFYLVAIFAEFIAPYDKSQRFDNAIYASPTTIHFIDSAGHLSAPFIYS